MNASSRLNGDVLVVLAVCVIAFAAPPSPLNRDYRTHELSACTKAPTSPHFALCDIPCTNVNKTHTELRSLPKSASGDSAVDVVQTMLARAWASSPHPSVDLFVRTGCHGAREAKYLLASVELFWPRGIGHVVLVLDATDRHLARHIMPRDGKHAYSVFYEHATCMPGRVFNQVSYLMADHYARADVIVTIDSDCVLHSPVTPRLLFRGRRILVPHSTVFQRDVWRPLVDRFVGEGAYQWHTMVSQPVTFHRSTFAAYRAWYAANHNGSCYLDGVADALDVVDAGPMTLFCWMCQLGTFVAVTGQTADLYDFVDVDAPTVHPYQRFSLHVTWEQDDESDYDQSARRAIVQGLCWSLGSALDGCDGMPTAYVEKYLFRYYDYDWLVRDEAKTATVDAYRRGVRRWSDR